MLKCGRCHDSSTFKPFGVLGPLPPGHPLTGTQLAPHIGYLMYNVGIEKMQGLILSAICFATRSSASPSLKAAISGSTLSGFIASTSSALPTMDADSVAALANTEWPRLSTWLSSGGNLRELSRLIEATDGNAWRSWDVPRGNMSRFRVLLDYYQRLH
jgi:hypothetical protein